MSASIYGQELELTEVEAGEMVMDIIILARVLRPTDDGRMEDALLVSSTKTTTGIVQMGMAVAFGESMGDNE